MRRPLTNVHQVEGGGGAGAGPEHAGAHASTFGPESPEPGRYLGRGPQDLGARRGGREDPWGVRLHDLLHNALVKPGDGVDRRQTAEFADGSPPMSR